MASARARDARHYIPTVPLPVFRRICRLGSAGYVFLLIWMRARMESTTSIRVTTALLQGFGFSRKVKAAALRALEEAGLIRVERRRGKNPVAILLT